MSQMWATDTVRDSEKQFLNMFADSVVIQSLKFSLSVILGYCFITMNPQISVT